MIFERFIKRGYVPIIMQRTACLVVSPYTVGNHAYLFVLHDDVGLNPDTEGRRRITVLSLFGRALYGFSAVALTSDRSPSTLTIG